MDLVIKNGVAVLETGVERVSIGVKDGQIAAIAEPEAKLLADRTLDVAGALVLPGGIDAHVHFENPSMGTQTAHTFRVGSEAALLGGTTTVVDFAFQQPGEGLIEAIKRRCASAESQVVGDYSLHGCMTSPSDAALAEIPALVAMGVPSIKFFLTYRQEGWAVSDAQLFAAMTTLSQVGGTACIHAENDELLQNGIAERLALGDVGAGGHARSRPPLLEQDAIQKAALYAERTRCSTFIVHVSAGVGSEVIAEARRRGVDIHGETCPHYLAFDDTVLDTPDGQLFVMSPPLRAAGNPQALWQALDEGVLESVGSDDAAYFREYKDRGAEDFRQIANGVPGAQIRLPYVLSEGRKRGIELSRLVGITATNPAKRFGLYPRKGAIRVGADADLIIYDDDLVVTPTVDQLHTPIEYSIYESEHIHGWPTTVLRRGEIVVADGRLCGTPGSGRFIPRRSTGDQKEGEPR